MHNCQRSYSIFRLRLLQEMGSMRVIFGYLWGIGYAAFFSMRYTAFASVLPTNPLEPIVLLTNNWSDMSFILLGFLFILSDIPFQDQIIYYTVQRSGKMQWVIGIILYLACTTILYIFAVMASGMIVCQLQDGVLNNSWSEAMNYLIKARPSNAIEIYSINICSRDILYGFEPYAATFYVITLLGLYYFLIAVIMFSINLNLWFPYGSFSGIIFHFFNLMVVKDGLMSFAKYTPISNSMLYFHVGESSISIVHSYIYYFILLIIIIISAFVIANNCDYGGR